MTKKPVVVTGGAGFVGGNLTKFLIQEGYEVVVLDNLSTGKIKNIDKRADFYSVDITNRNKLFELFKKIKPKFVFHLAANASIILAEENKLENCKNNLIGTINVLDGLIELDSVKQLIFASTFKVYDSIMPQEGYSTISSPTNPNSIYGIMKLAAEKIIVHQSKIPFTSLRMFNVIGPLQRLDDKTQGVLSIFLGQKLRGEKPTVYNNGEQTRDFVFIDDVCGAFLKSIENESAHNKILNIGTGIETSILQIIKLLGIKDYGVGKRQDDHIYSKMGDLDYTKRYLKWSPTTTLEEGIKQTISWGEEIHGQEKSNTTKIR